MSSRVKIYIGHIFPVCKEWIGYSENDTDIQKKITEYEGKINNIKIGIMKHKMNECVSDVILPNTTMFCGLEINELANTFTNTAEIFRHCLIPELPREHIKNAFTSLFPDINHEKYPLELIVHHNLSFS